MEIGKSTISPTCETDQCSIVDQPTAYILQQDGKGGRGLRKHVQSALPH